MEPLTNAELDFIFDVLENAKGETTLGMRAYIAGIQAKLRELEKNWTVVNVGTVGVGCL